MTSPLLGKLKADFEKRKRKVVVLGQEIWVTPLTDGENARIFTLHPSDAALRHAEMLVLKCRDAQGKPVFAKDDKRALANEVAADQLAPLILAIQGASVEEQEKN